jgi:hypothetical protein
MDACVMTRDVMMVSFFLSWERGDVKALAWSHDIKKEALSFEFLEKFLVKTREPLHMLQLRVSDGVL